MGRGGVKDTRLEANDTKKPQAKAKAKDSPSEGRLSRGQGQKCSRPRTQAQVLSKKKVFIKIVWQSPEKNVFQKIFQPLHKILRIQKIVLS